MTAGYLNITQNYLRKGMYLLVTLSAILMALMAVVFLEACRTWFRLLRVSAPAPAVQVAK